MRSEHNDSNRCVRPVDSAILSDYWLGLLSEADEDDVELHLMACGLCAERLGRVVALTDGIRNLAREGSLLIVVSDTFLQQAQKKGLHVRQYTPPRGGAVACTVTAEDDLLIGRLTADLSAAKRVDLLFCDRNGVERRRLADIPFNPDERTVNFQNSITYAKAAASETLVTRLISVDDAGVESLIGEYTFNHTRTLPGPGI